jgi:hypothetical protein
MCGFWPHLHETGKPPAWSGVRGSQTSVCRACSNVRRTTTPKVEVDEPWWSGIQLHVCIARSSLHPPRFVPPIS